MFAFFKQTCARKTTTRTNRFRPEVHALEDRQLLRVSSLFSGGVLTLTGNNNIDRLRLSHDGLGHIEGFGGGISVNQIGVKKLVINTKGGQDKVFFTQTGDLKQDFVLDVNLGNDEDNFTADLQGDIINSTMNLNVHGGNDDDRIRVNANEDVDIQAAARLLVNLQTGGGENGEGMEFFYGGELDGTLDVDMTGNRKKNGLTTKIRIDAKSTGRVGDGDGGSRMDAGRGKDFLEFLVSDVSGASINAEMFGGAQFDEGKHTTNVRAVEVEQNEVVNFQ